MRSLSASERALLQFSLCSYGRFARACRAVVVRVRNRGELGDRCSRATSAAAQPIVALSDYDSERLELAVKGSVVCARDGRLGIVKISYATRRGSTGTAISVDFDGTGGVNMKQSDWSDGLDKIALGCLTIGSSGGSQAANLVLWKNRGSAACKTSSPIVTPVG